MEEFWTRLKRTVAPTTSVVSQDEVRAHLNIDENDEQADTLLPSYIGAATAFVEGPKGCGLALLNQTWRYSCDDLNAPIVLRMRPISGVTSITYLDEAGDQQTLDPTLYTVDLDADPVVIQPRPGASWPAVYGVQGSVKVTFTAGFGSTPSSVPADLRAAIRLVVGDLWRNRESLTASDLKEIPSPFGFERVMRAWRPIL